MSAQSTQLFHIPTQREISQHQTSPEGDQRSIKRVRASKPKVKSGCLTCKARRVKCDETKPQCLRCKKFGRSCDGYTKHTTPRGLIQLQPRTPSITLYRPSTSIHVTEDESRYFQIFADCSAYELSGFFDDSFWSRLVLQESHNVEAIRHAIIALGALNKCLETAPSPLLKVNIIQDIDKKHHEQAVFQYLKAIQTLNQYISESGSPQLRNALITCILFICFETFLGSFASSIQQTFGGIKLLRGYFQGREGKRPTLPPFTKSRKRTIHSRQLPDCEIPQIRQESSSQVKDHLPNGTRSSHTEDQSRTFREHSTPGPVQLATPQTTIIEPDIYTGQPRTMNIFSVSDGSGYGSSDSGGFYREPSSHHSLAKDVLRHGSLAIASREFSRQGIHTPPVSHSEGSNGKSLNSTPRRKSSPSISVSTSPLLQNDLQVEETLIQTFMRLDGPGLFFGMKPGIPPLEWDIHKLFELPIPSSFPSFVAARRCWDFLMDRCLQFYRRTLFNKEYAPHKQESDESIARQYSEFMNQLATFERTFKPLLDAALSPTGTVAHAQSLIISLYIKCTTLLLSQVIEPSEMIYDSYLPSFQYIIRTCSLIIASETDLQMPRNRRFSLETGLVPPLHVTATKCRDPELRRQAVELMFQSPRQEGMWDSVLSARICRWIIAYEEEGMNPPPSSKRGSDGASLFDAGVMGTFGPHMDKREVPLSNSTTSVMDAAEYGIGSWEGGKKISEWVNISIGRGPRGEDFLSDSLAEAVVEPLEMTNSTTTKRTSKKKKNVGEQEKQTRVSVDPTHNLHNSIPAGGSSNGWIVPEEHRVQLTVVSFHIPDRYIRVKCQRTVHDLKGNREERETIIAW